MSRTQSQVQLDAFREAAQSLKLYRRAEIADSSGSLIEQLYVDPLPNNHVLNTMLKSSTTFIVGRKGTGKSTIFQRAQHELRRTPGLTSAYIDIKTVYESSQVDPQLSAKLTSIENVMPPESLERLLLNRAFLASIIEAIRAELKSRIKGSVWQRMKGAFGGSLEELFAGLDELLNDADADRFVSVLATRVETGTSHVRQESVNERASGAKASASQRPTIDLTGGRTSKLTSASDEEKQHADVLMRVFDIKEYILRLKLLLSRADIKHLYIFVDDFSELPAEAMRVVVDTILAPLNNWSDELVKFKVAAYPGRIYYGAIDKTKIDEINLDLYSLYGTGDIAGMEEKAVDFTRRLILRRLEHFGGANSEDYFEFRGRPEDLWRQLFYATMANPRNLGYLLFFVYESHLLYGEPVTLRSVRDAARRYYEEKIEAYFGMNRFLHESFEERSSVFSLKELLENLVLRARDVRRHQGSLVMRELGGRPPTSHFHVAVELEALLATLELNFFLTKYYVMKDRDGRKVSIYALNYGLCQQQTIEFGRPAGRREFRLYYIERPFDYSPILQEYLRTNQEIACEACGERYEHEQLASLQLFRMMCPTCHAGTCVVTNLSRRYAATLRAIDDDLLLPRVELGILHTLGTERRPLAPGDIAGELDCSYQLVGKRAKILADRGLVDRGTSEQGRRQLSATDRARRIYLTDLPD